MYSAPLVHTNRSRPFVWAECNEFGFEAIDPLAFAEIVSKVTHYSHEFGMLSVTFDDCDSFSVPCGEATQAAIVSIAGRALKQIGWPKIEAKLVRQCRRVLIVARSTRLPVGGGVGALQSVASDIVNHNGCRRTDFRQALAFVCQSESGSIRTESRQGSDAMWHTDVYLGSELLRTADLRCDTRTLSERSALLLALQQQVALRSNTVAR